MAKPTNITPLRRFGRLTAVTQVKRPNQSKVFWECKCDCGKSSYVRACRLSMGITISCGCLRGKRAACGEGRVRRATRKSWYHMIQRCTNPKHAKWANYGARGIRVCDRWLSLDSFVEDMGLRPDGKTLDRYPNGEGNYEPGNCRWATGNEQANNTRRNRRIVLDGRSLTITEWSREIGIASSTIEGRLARGLAASDALSKHRQSAVL